MMYREIDGPLCCSSAIHKDGEGQVVNEFDCGKGFLPPTLEQQLLEVRRTEPDLDFSEKKRNYVEKAAAEGRIDIKGDIDDFRSIKSGFNRELPQELQNHKLIGLFAEYVTVGKTYPHHGKDFTCYGMDMNSAPSDNIAMAFDLQSLRLSPDERDKLGW